MKILIAYDGSKEADNALVDLSMAGLPAKVEALVLGVAVPWADYFGTPDPVSGRSAAMGLDETRAFDNQAKKSATRTGRRALDALRKRYPRWKISAETRFGSPAKEILARADSWKPDLIVMGAHGRGALGRFLMGSVSQKVLNHSRYPVRISRNGSPKAKAPRLLVGFDGSADCEHALGEIISRRWPEGTQIRLLAVFNDRLILDNAMLIDSLEGSARIRGLETSWTERRMADWKHRLEGKGLYAEQECVYGDPRRALLRKAGEWPADCIFLGSRGHSAVGRFLIGSVSSAVAAHAKCPVEIVRARKPARKKERKRA